MFEYFAIKQISQGITGFFVDSLFNFQGSERSARFRASLLIVSHPLRFVKRFFRFFQNLFRFWPLRVCDSHIIVSHRVRFVKNFFHLFSRFFRSRFAPAAFPRQLFSLYRAAFCAFSAPSLCDSFAILSLSGGKVKPFFLDFLCLLILLIWRPRLLTIVTKVVRMFSTAITARIVECVDYYCPCI